VSTASNRLDSWKEIAAYLNRGVRTVRRWETEEGLPVHRHVHRALGSVYAYKSEIDAWRSSEQRAVGKSVSDGTRARSISRSPKSIAVLPFANLSSGLENDYFADGLTDELIANLSRILSLRVTSRTSSMAFKGANKDVRTIAKALGVRYILEGAVRRAGNRLRISAQLIEASADEHVWADIYDGSIEDVFAMQERLARVIVSALELRLTEDEDRRLAERPIPDVRAYECYLRARHEAWRWRQDAIDRAVQLLRTGLEIVGDNAELYAALGFAYLQYREAGIDFTEHPLGQADACAARAFALDPSSAPTLRLRAWIHYSRAEVQQAVQALKAARDMDPNNADTLLLLANCYLISGRTSSARLLIQPLLAIDPLTPLTRCLPGYADVLEGRFAAAVEPYRQMFEMDPDNPMARLFYVFILSLNKRTAAIRDVVQQFAPDVKETIPARVALFLARAHDKDERAARSALTSEIESVASASDVFPRLLAHGFALLGDSDRALHWLEVAVQRGFINYPFLAKHDPSLAQLRKHPRWSELLGTVRQRWERFEE